MKELWRRISGTLSIPLDATSVERERKLLYIHLLLIAVISVLVLLVVFILDRLGIMESSLETVVLYIATGTGVLSTGIVFLVSRFSVRAASWVFVLLLWISAVLSDTPAYHIDGRSLVAFAVSIVIAGVLLPPYASTIVAAMSVLFVLILSLVYGTIVTPGFVLLLVIALPTAVLSRTLKEALAYWQLSTAQMTRLNQVVGGFNAAVSLDEVLDVALAEGERLGEVAFCQVCLLDDQTSDPTLCYTLAGYGEEDRGLDLPKWNRAMIDRVVEQGEAVLVNDVSNGELEGMKDDAVVGSLVAAPMKSRHSMVGVTLVGRPEKGCFSEADLDLLELFAASAAGAIERARLHREVQQLAAFNEGIVQNMAEGVVVEDADGTFTLVNPAAATLLGYDSPDELVGLHWKVVIPPDQRSIVQEVNERRARGESGRYELDMMCKDGRRISVLVGGSPRFEESGDFAGTLAVFTDITEQRRAAEALQESEEKYRALYENAPLSYQSLDIEGCLIDINPAWLRTLGYEREEVVGKRFVDFLHPDWKPHFESRFAEFRRCGYAHDVHFRIRHKQGHYLDVSFEGCASYRPDGSFRQTYCVFQDITERVRAEQALRESEARERARAAELETIMDAVPAIIWIARDPECHHIFGNQASYHLLRMEGGVNTSLTPAEGPPPSHFHFSRNGMKIPPHKLPMQTVTARGMPIKNYEEEVVFDDGTKRYIFGNAVPLRDEEGRIRGAVSAFVDITERKETEQALRASEARFRDLAWEKAELLEQARNDAQIKETLLQEVNHRVKNNLAAIIGLVQAERRQEEVLACPTCQSSLDALSARIRGLALAHDMLSATEWKPLPLHTLVRRIILSVAQTIPCDRDLVFDVVPSAAQVSHRQANSIALVINELATNAIKYAVSGDGRTNIQVDIDTEDGIMTCEFRDDGPGYPADVLQGEGYNVGLYLVDALVRHDLQGRLTFENDDGAVARVQFAQAEGE